MSPVTGHGRLHFDTLLEAQCTLPDGSLQKNTPFKEHFWDEKTNRNNISLDLCPHWSNPH